MKRTTLLGWVLPGLAAVAVAAVLIVWQWPHISSNGAPASTAATSTVPATAASTPVQTFTLEDGNTPAGLAESADHVRVTALRRANTVTTQIHVDQGWHINANPASLDFLIPTALTLRSQGAALSATVDYPQGHTIDVGLAQPIAVYSDTVTITATVPDGTPAAALHTVLRVQACSDNGRCLMPSTLQIQPLAANGS